MKKIVPQLTADDPHTLAKCLEAADTILCLEMIFRSADMRKESRGIMYPHYRTDYPETDNENWLRWINIRQGKDGEMELFTEDIPMWRYPIRPEGYTSLTQAQFSIPFCIAAMLYDRTPGAQWYSAENMKDPKGSPSWTRPLRR